LVKITPNFSFAMEDEAQGSALVCM